VQRVFNCVVVLVVAGVCLIQGIENYGFEKDSRFSNNQIDILRNRLNSRGPVPHTDDLAIYRQLQEVSVKVISARGSGSGVVFTRNIAGKQKTFVWTAGHVIDGLQQDDGSFAHVTVLVEMRTVHGKFVCKKSLPAKVIAFSDPDNGQDLALLEVLDDGAQLTWLHSAKFADASIQPVGTEIIHVGSTAGLFNSVSLGIISQTDRDLGDGLRYDQTTSMAYPGSSGGGVYTRNGECIGLLTRGIGPGLNFFVPMRRVRAWAKEEGIEWALDRNVPVPLTRDPTRFEEETWPLREVI